MTTYVAPSHRWVVKVQRGEGTYVVERQDGSERGCGTHTDRSTALGEAHQRNVQEAAE